MDTMSSALRAYGIMGKIEYEQQGGHIMSEQLIFRDRRGTNAMKWNHLDRIGFRGTDLLGM